MASEQTPSQSDTRFLGNMTALERGQVYELPGGKRIEIMDNAFIYGGVRWVAVLDQDFDGDPVVFKVARIDGARRLA